MKDQSESGHTIIFALIALSLAVVMMQSSHERALHTLKTERIVQSGQQRYAKLIASTPHRLERPGTCISLVSSDTVMGAWDACYEAVRPTKIWPPMHIPVGKPNYDAIFKRATLCPSPLRPTPASLFRTPVTHASCLIPAPLEADLILKENIVGNSLSWAGRRQELPFITVASPGYIEIPGSLTLQQDALIVAGGSLTVGSIVNPVDRPISVTILSALGPVEVTRVAGPVSLVVMGTDLIRAPLTPVSSFLPLPPMRIPSLLTLSVR